MSEQLRFDGEVALVTGAGQGVGRAYALELARRGARVVVNDLGVRPDGHGGDSGPAQKVVEEITAAGGEAVANSDNVAIPSGGQTMVQAALDKWGRLDSVIHNAGILRDGTFAKLDPGDFEKVLGVHLYGAVNVAKPAFQFMKQSGQGGRILLTTSSAGLFGNFGQTSYAVAKMGVVGLVRVLSIEGAKYGIKANAVAPTAGTRLTGGQDAADEKVLSPAKLAATGVVLCHRNCPSTGEIFQSGGGWVARIALRISGGWQAEGPQAAEDLLAHWNEVREGDWREPANAIELGALLQEKLGVEQLEY